MAEIKLTRFAKAAGWAAKICQLELMRILHQLPKFDNPKILVGNEHMDDAGVYAIDENLAIVQTVDMLTPIADDPYIFGQIVAANSLSDIYAMGGKPISALSIICYPPDQIECAIVARILEGVGSKVKEAGASIIGGHTIRDPEVKCGLAVNGLVRPDSIVTNKNAKPGDNLILTKPLGTGIISTALKVNLLTQSTIKKANDIMCELNKNACEAMLKAQVTCATDVTGFGLLGHAWEIAEASNVSFRINASQVPVMPEVLKLVDVSIFPGGSGRNYEFIKTKTNFADSVRYELKMILCDAQTSGGLLISISKEHTEKLVDLLIDHGVMSVRVIGEVIEPQDWRIFVE